MFVKNLPDQVQALIEHYCNGSLLAFSKKIDVPQSTLQRYMATRDEKNILKILPKILHHCPEVREGWLYTGEGEMFGRSRPNGIRSAENSRGKLIGDMLYEALGLAQLDPEDIARAAGLEKSEWQAVLESSEFPSFLMLQALYDQFGLNTEYLFSEDSKMPWLPLSQVQVVEFLVGRESGYPPHISDLQEWFGCTKEEARKYDKEYKNWLEQTKNLGFEHAWNKGISAPRLKREWIEHFCQHAELEWLPDTRPMERGLIRLRRYSPQEEKQRLEAELSELRLRLDEAQQKIIRLQEEIITLKGAQQQFEMDEMGLPGDIRRDKIANLPISALGGQQGKG